MSFIKTGRCLCGEIEYQITAEPLFTHACHCNACQKITGTSHWLSMFMLDSDFEITQGELDTINPPQKYGIATKHFCAKCGSNIYGTHTMLPKIKLPATGTFDDNTWFAPEAHIHVQSKPAWITISGDAPQFDTFYQREEVWPQESLDRLSAALAEIE